MRTILFVDDQKNILDGLRRMLRSMRDEWEMLFAESGQEALNILKEKPCDVLVSDMRMPEMNGAQLLSQVAKKYPQVVRIVLSGDADKETVLQTTVQAHQYLSKPCDADTLKATVARACSLRDLLSDSALRRIVTQVTILPSLPSLYTMVMEELQSEKTSLDHVGSIIEQDVAMTAKLLQLVNSSFFGFKRQVSRVRDAVPLLGADVLKALVLSVGIFSQFQNKKPLHGISIDTISEHSLRVANYAKVIAISQKADRVDQDQSFLAGILHDLGKLILWTNFPNEYGEVCSMCSVERCTVSEAEKRHFQASHEQVAAYLLGLWGFADAVVEAVAFHHHPGCLPLKRFTPLTALHVANAFDHFKTDALVSLEAGVDESYLREIGLYQNLPAWALALSDSTPEKTDCKV